MPRREGLTRARVTSSLTPRRTTWLSLFLLSAASLAFEVDLTRLFSVAQFYHFAFMIVSIALLGFGASGTALSIVPRLRNADPGRRLSQLALCTGLTILAAYLLTNWLPFDSFNIAWDRKQIPILILNYLALAAPFFFSGMALGLLLAASPDTAGSTYAANLFGSAGGCLIALIVPAWVGAEGIVLLAAALAALAGLLPALVLRPSPRPLVLGTSALLALALCIIGLRLATGRSLPLFDLRLSPYKSLSYALQYPGSRVIDQAWNSFARLDVVRSGGIHSVPGLSYRYLQPLPSMDALLIDGDDLSPIATANTDAGFTSYLPEAAAFSLRTAGNVLILEPRGGMDVLTALTLGAGRLTAVEVNPLIVQAAPIYSDPRLQVHIESDRSYLRRTTEKYDLIVLSLASSFHPVRSGAYSLSEDYRYTVEAFQDALAHLEPSGLLTATRWLQNPPSEDLRLFALAVTAMENSRLDPRTQVAAFRGFNTATVLLKASPFTTEELASLRLFLRQRAFDLSYAPDVRADETNVYSVFSQPVYYQAYMDLLDARPRQAFYAAYPYDVRPPTDDQPFFAHYFKWTQAPQILAEFGTAWLPFGGAGYFVILGLLLLAVLLAAILILLPLALARGREPRPSSAFRWSHLVYFGLLGLAFLLVEVPLLQGFILYLGQPAFAVAVVLCSLLFFSGLGSRLSPRIPLRIALVGLVLLIILLPAGLRSLFDATLGLPLASRFGLSALVLAPLGFLMGVPFPGAIRSLRPDTESQDVNIPWIWAVNGAASVIASILAALLALTFGFSWVLRLGAACYAGAWLTAWTWHRSGALPSPARRAAQRSPRPYSKP